MKFFVLLIGGISLLCIVNADSKENDEKKIVCYYNSHSAHHNEFEKLEISNINPLLCTHLIFRHINISEINITEVDPNFDLFFNADDANKQFSSFRTKNSDIKIMLTNINTRWNESSSLSEGMQDPTLHESLANNIVRYLKKYQYDGFDAGLILTDAEESDKVDVKNFEHLLKTLKNKFEKENLILSAALIGPNSVIDALKFYDILKILKNVDFVNLMFFHRHGLDKEASIHSGDNDKKLGIKMSINYWLAEEAPKEKLILGIPAYGKSFKRDSESNDVDASIIGLDPAGVDVNENEILGFNEICTKLQSMEHWLQIHELEENGLYSPGERQHDTFDYIKAVEDKAEFIKKMGLGGAVIWSIDMDDFNGKCGPQYPILNAVNKIFNRDWQEKMFGNFIDEDHGFTYDDPVPFFPAFESYSPPDDDEHSIFSPNFNDNEIAENCKTKEYLVIPDSCDYVHCERIDGSISPKIKSCPDNFCFDPEQELCDYKL